jgi:NAD(P)-dependent dehydrogenase (short-subunit alcohol dehydrogenase family)
MPEEGVLIVGGTSGLGRRIAEAYAARGRTVIVTGRDRERAGDVAAGIGNGASGLGLDLASPHEIADRLNGVGAVDRLVLSAIERDFNTVQGYDVDAALRLVTLKLVGYTEVVRTMHSRLGKRASVLLFGGLAKDRPYPGSTTVTSVNGAVTTMVRTFALELAPIRVNAIHPGIVGDSPAWQDNEAMIQQTLERTPSGHLPTMDDVADAAIFLLENRAANGINLPLDGGWLLR